MAAWLDWARAYVEDFDPLSSASLEELRAEIEHLLSLPKDDGDWDEDEQEWRDMGWLVARRELGQISHSMALEDQAVDDEEEDERLRRFIADELDPREIWARRP